MLNNKLLELNEVLIHLFVAVSLRINAILTQYNDEQEPESWRDQPGAGRLYGKNQILRNGNFGLNFGSE